MNERGESGTLSVVAVYRANRWCSGPTSPCWASSHPRSTLCLARGSRQPAWSSRVHAVLGCGPGVPVAAALTRLVIRIDFDARGECRFFAATRLVAAFPAGEISEVSRNPRGLIVVRYPGGSLWVLRPDGLDAFATAVIGANASAIIKL